MKKTAKILIGVLSVGALIGTGYATWHISGGFTGDEATLTPGVETVVDKNFGYIEVTAVKGDDFIIFDGDANDDLTISYMVKAFANEGSDRNPYDLTNYEGIANEYIPNLKVETIVKEGDAELGKDDPFFKYVDLPSSAAIDYKTWLASENKDTGYKVTLNFSWSKETLGGKNPEQAWKGLSVEEQETKYQELISALKDVEFTFKFIVGNDDGVVEEPETPTTTDVITLPKVEGSTLTIEGLNDGVVEAGEHALTLDITEENKALKDSTLFVTKLSKDGVKTEDEVVLKESGNRSIFKSYEGTYNFEAEYAYTFNYELEDLTTPEPDVFKTIYIKDLANLNEYGSTAYVYAWNTISNIENAEWPGEKVDSISWNIFDDNACVYRFDLNLTQYTHFIFSTKGADGNDKGQTVDIPVDDLGENDFVVLTSVNTEGKYNAEFKDYASTIAEYEAKVNLTFNEAEGKVTYDNLPHYNNDEITLTIEPNEGYEIGDVTFGDTKVTPNESGEYKVVLKSGENNINVTFKKVIPEENYSINQITAAGNYTIRGVVTNIGKSSFVVSDMTGGILVFGHSETFAIGDYIEVSGEVTKYNSYLEFTESASITKLEDTTGKPEVVVDDLNVETVNYWATLGESEDTVSVSDVKTYKWETTCGKSGNFFTLNLDGTDVLIEPYNLSDDINLTEGYKYTIVGTFISFNTTYSYASVMVKSAELIESIPTEVNIVQPESTTIAVNETLKLSYTTDKDYVTAKPIWTSDSPTIATVDETGLVTGMANGEVNITISFGEGVSSTIKIIVNGVAAETETHSFIWKNGTGSLDSKQYVLTINDGDFTIVLNKENGSNLVKNTFDEMRMYANSSLTISSSTRKIKSIILHLTEAKYVIEPVLDETMFSYSLDKDNKTTTINSLESEGTNEFKFTNSAQIRVSSIDIVYLK